MKAPIFNTGYNTDPEKWSEIHGTPNDEPSVTQQSFASECDINTIVKRFGVTGELPNVVPAQYGDFTGVTDYQSALNAVREAGVGFMSMDADIRAHFDNDPAKFVAFVSDEKNRSKAQELGLVMAPIPAGDVKPIGGVPADPNS